MTALLVLPFLLSGMMFASNPVMMSYGGGDVSPFWFGVWANLGIGMVMLVMGLVCLAGPSWRWRSVFGGEVSLWPLAVTVLSRLSYSFFLTAGYFIDYGVVAVLGALFPMVSLLLGWFIRRGTESPQLLGRSTWLLASVGFLGAGLAMLSQSTDGGLYVLDAPLMSSVGAVCVVLASVVGSMQAYGLRFWIKNRSALVRSDGLPPLVCRAAFVPYFLSSAFGSFACSGLSLVVAVLSPLPGVSIELALCNGMVIGFGLVLWSVGVMVCRSPAAHLLLYVETLAGLALLRVSGLSPDLNWLMLMAGCVLLVGSGVWAGFYEVRRQEPLRKGLVT